MPDMILVFWNVLVVNMLRLRPASFATFFKILVLSLADSGRNGLWSWNSSQLCWVSMCILFIFFQAWKVATRQR